MVVEINPLEDIRLRFGPFFRTSDGKPTPSSAPRRNSPPHYHANSRQYNLTQDSDLPALQYLGACPYHPR